MVALVGNHETGGGSSIHQTVSDIPFFFRYFSLAFSCHSLYHDSS
jgi:hypothetical protein